MDDALILEWTYLPPDYFEEPKRVTGDHYNITIENGRAEARMSPDVYERDRNIRDALQEVLTNRFLAAQLLTHKAYTLSQASVCRVHPDGRRDITPFVEPCVAEATVQVVDTLIKNGNVVSDSRRERLDRERALGDLLGRYRRSDPLLACLVRSYQAAVEDPDNELVHLYEIRDALSAHFGSERAAGCALGIATRRWSRLGRLANAEPLKQGRHRGKSGAALRNATEHELDQARSIARDLVVRYGKYLEKQGP